MRFLAVHRSANTSLATNRLWLTADEVSGCESVQALLQRLERLTTERDAELIAARAQAAAEGREQGRSEALASVAPRLLDAWDQAARSAAADAQALRAALVTLSLQVVQRISVELGPAEVVTALARRASESLLPDSAAVLRVHPDVAAAVRARMLAAPGTSTVPLTETGLTTSGITNSGLTNPGLTNSVSGILEVRGDPQLGRFDCAFDTAAGQLLAGLPAQLARLAAQLQEGGR